MEIVTGTVDNVSEGYYHQTTKKGGNSPVSHHTVSFTIANKQAHFRTHNPPSINPGDEVTIAGKSLSSGLNVTKSPNPCKAGSAQAIIAMSIGNWPVPAHSFPKLR